MTSKDYETIAEVIAPRPTAGVIERKVRRDIAIELCSVLKADNARFDAIRFMQTCGGIDA